MHHNKLVIEPGFCIAAALFLYLLPINWVLSWFVASLIHELCHCAVLWVCRVKILSVRITAGGAMIETEFMPWSNEFIATLAGPIGGLCLLMLAHVFPALSLCAFVQSIYNLLPVYPLDGGRALRCVLCHYYSDDKGGRISLRVNQIVFAILLLFCIILTVCLNLGFFPIIIVCMIYIRSQHIKFPCKRRKQIVQ